jgi:hypothetical protein
VDETGLGSFPGTGANINGPQTSDSITRIRKVNSLIDCSGLFNQTQYYCPLLFVYITGRKCVGR